MNELELLDRIEYSVRSKTRCAKAFTAYSITKRLRKRGFEVSHEVVRLSVHRLFQSGGMGACYTRTLCDVGGARGAAWVYHHCENSPEKYAKCLRKRNLG